MVYPALYAGQRFTAGVATSMLPLEALKTATTDRASTTTVTADPELVIAVEANAEYILTGYLRISGTTTPKMDIQISVPSGTTGGYSCTRLSTSATADSGDANEVRTSTRITFDTETTFNTISTTAHQVLQISGRVIVGGTAGNLSIDWAQNVSNATACSMHSDSWISLRRVS